MYADTKDNLRKASDDLYSFCDSWYLILLRQKKFFLKRRNIYNEGNLRFDGESIAVVISRYIVDS